MLSLNLPFIADRRENGLPFAAFCSMKAAAGCHQLPISVDGTLSVIVESASRRLEKMASMSFSIPTLRDLPAGSNEQEE
ncbi:MAG: hypothetical protein ABSD75_04290 [Terriglobales bacterium]|jgi:hypothetical protein